MESKITSSFIPKKPVTPEAEPRKAKYSTNTLDVFMLISIVLIVVAGVLSGGVFLYRNFVESDVANKQAQLEQARGAFDPKLIEELEMTSNRIRVAGTILEQHTAPSILLSSLEQDTLSGVQITDFEYTQRTPDLALIEMKGKSGSMNTVALQSSRFGESSIIRNPIFSGIDIVSDGVVFEVTGEVDLNSLRYASIAGLSGNSLQQTPQIQFDDIPLDEFMLGDDVSNFGLPNQ